MLEEEDFLIMYALISRLRKVRQASQGIGEETLPVKGPSGSCRVPITDRINVVPDILGEALYVS